MNKGVLKSFYDKITVLTILVPFSAIIILLVLLKPRIEQDMLFYFFSSIAQSMAALFAVVGMFAIFRYQNLGESIRNKILLLRNRLNSPAYLYFCKYEETDMLNDEDLIEYLIKRCSEIDRSRFTPQDFKYVEVNALVISHKIKVRNSTKTFAVIPMTVILISFVSSLISLLLISNYFTQFCSIKIMGIIIIWSIILCVLISMISILRYFKISF